MSSDNFGSFMTGLVFGVAAGVTAGVLLAPKSGAETRQDLKDAANKLKTDAENLYSSAKAKVDTKLADLKDLSEKIDKKKYLELVDEVVADLKTSRDVSESKAKELGTLLKDDWNTVKSTVTA